MGTGMPTTKYFILRDDQVSGPLSKQQVLAAIKSKKLRKTDLLGTSAEGPWQKVEDAVGTKTPVESEASSSPVAPTLPDSGLAKAKANFKKRKALEKRKEDKTLQKRNQKRKAKESAEQADFLKQIVKTILIGVLVVVIGPIVYFSTLGLSKAGKLNRAADSALSSMMTAAAAYEVAVDMKKSPKSEKLKEKYENKMNDAAAELDSILSQMSPEAREAWEESKIEQEIQKEVGRRRRSRR